MLKLIQIALPMMVSLMGVCQMRMGAATYYVAQTGNDQNSCLSAEQACQTLGRASQKADQPGDVVRVGAGNYNERITINKGGSAGAPITYTGSHISVCPSVVTSDLNSRGSRPSPNVSVQGFFVAASNVVVDCFTMTGSPLSGEAGAGVYINSQVSSVTVTNNVVDGSLTPGRPWAGVAMKSGIAPADFARDVTVRQNYVRNTGYGFMIYCGANCLFENNEVDELKAEGGKGDNDYSRIFGESVTLRGNYFHGNRIADCVGCHIDCFQSYNVGGIDNIARFITVDANTCFGAHQAFIIRDVSSKELGAYQSHHTWRITNNVLGLGPLGSTSTWCGLFDHVGDVAFEHNLCVSTGVVGYLNGSTGTHRFNIHLATGWKPYTSQLAGWAEGLVESTGNLLYRSDGTYVASQWPGDIVNREPLFVNTSALNFRIRSQSPARNAAPKSVLGIDRSGLARPQERMADIGPYEYSRRGTLGVR